MADTPLSALKRSVASSVAGFPVRVPSSLRLSNMRSMLETSIGSGERPTTIETPPGRRPLKVAATVLPPEAVIRMTLAPPSACRASAGSVAALFDVVVRAELLRQYRHVGATANRRDLKPHVRGILHTEMTQAADTEHSHKIAGLRRCVSQGAECRDARAQQRRRIDQRQVVRDRHEPTRLCDHHFGISAIIMNAGIFLVPAVHEIAIAAELANSRKSRRET